jgi:hypothetical protein
LKRTWFQVSPPSVERCAAVKVPTRTQASRLAGLRNSSEGLPPGGETTAYTVPAEAAIDSMLPPKESLRPADPYTVRLIEDVPKLGRPGGTVPAPDLGGQA